MALSKKHIVELTALLKKNKLIKLAYLFGSHARGDNGLTSDYDIAVYVDTRNKMILTDILLDLAGKIPLILGTDKLDVVVINLIDNLILKNNIITQGQLIYEVKGFRLDVETHIVAEYRDFRIMEQQYYPD